MLHHLRILKCVNEVHECITSVECNYYHLFPDGKNNETQYIYVRNRNRNNEKPLNEHSRVCKNNIHYVFVFFFFCKEPFHLILDLHLSESFVCYFFVTFFYC